MKEYITIALLNQHFSNVHSINPTSQNISQTEDGNVIHTPISGWGYGAGYVSENK